MNLCKMKYIWYYSLFLAILQDCNAATHWVVTEDGRIQTMLNSLFQMRRPYDLVALMKQEERLEKVESMKHGLINQKEMIEKNEDKETDLEMKYYASDPDCIDAGKPLTSFDLYSSTVVSLETKGFSFQDFVNTSIPLGPGKHNQPFCTEIIDLDFSMHAFEHLQAMQLKHNLTMEPEIGLIEALPQISNTLEFGYHLSNALKKDNKSWMLYNLATYYWRVVGDAKNAVECVRRALHFSPWEHKDVALINLSNILRRSHRTEEAAVVAFAAVTAVPSNAVAHFTLGTIFAMVGDYDQSATCFVNALKRQPDMKLAGKFLHAIRCTSKLERALENQHSSLQRTLSELMEYRQQHEILHKHQEKLLAEQAPPDERIHSQLHYEEIKMNQNRKVDECVRAGKATGECTLQTLFHQHVYSTLELGVRIQLLFSLGSNNQDLNEYLNQMGERKENT